MSGTIVFLLLLGVVGILVLVAVARSLGVIRWPKRADYYADGGGPLGSGDSGGGCD